MILKDTCSLEEKLWPTCQHIKKQGHYFADKGLSSQSYSFSSSHVWMWELDHKESWVLKNWCFWTVVLEKALKSPLDCKEIKPVNPKGNQSWIFIGRTEAKAEPAIVWPPDFKELTHWKRLWCWERLKAGRERDDRGWNGWIASPARWTWVWASSGSLWLTGKFGVLQSMGSQPDMTEQLKWTELNWTECFRKECGLSLKAKVGLEGINSWRLSVTIPLATDGKFITHGKSEQPITMTTMLFWPPKTLLCCQDAQGMCWGCK